ncbi:MEIOTIC F-BOX protein MOF-like [Miscanthus floridulus]|uniref:MEIOTIC F-BOX protein MOF-like n=1 Tax=Miscanthus floridulus TaxID=154761 RepID=UPI00345AB2CD
MRTHHPSKRGSMEEEDRLSSLPDDLLHSILRLLPFKHAVRTSALSRRWAPQWLRALASSRVLDFTDRDLARGQLPARAAEATMRRCLKVHAEHGAPLDVFRVALMLPPGSSDGVFGRDVVGWIASAVARGAREVEVYLTLTPTQTYRGQVPNADDGSAEFVELPSDLFVARNSLARLALVGIASETLRVLEIVGCIAVKQVQVTAPALESIAFHSDEFFWEDANDVVFDFDDDMPALRDVYLSQIGFAHDSDETYLLLSELQLLIASKDDYDDDLEVFTSFFQENKLPLLDRLFVRFLGHVTDASDADAAAALAGEVVDNSEHEINDKFVLDSLSFIKLVNFRGTRFEL